MPPINFKFPLNTGPLGFFRTNNNTKDAVRENLKLTILTNSGERLINEVGSKYVFDLTKQSKEEITKFIEDHTEELFDAYFNFLRIEKIDVLDSSDNESIGDNEVLVSIKYSFRNIEQTQDEVSILFNNN